METQISFSNQEKYPRQGFMQRNALSVKIILDFSRFDLTD